MDGTDLAKRSPVSWQCEVLDLPGTYSLEPLSPEEAVTCQVLADREVDAAIVVADATHLERTLYLALQVSELKLPVVLALTMIDLACSQGISIDVAKLATGLGMPVCLVEQGDRRSLERLMETVRQVLERADSARGGRASPQAESVVGRALDQAGAGAPAVAAPLPQEGVEETLAAASHRYATLQRVLAAAVRRRNATQVSDQIDRWALHPWLGYFILVVVMGTFFWLTFAASAPLIDALDQMVRLLTESTRRWLADVGGGRLPAPAIGFITDGVLGGVGTVLSFLPLMAIFFFLFAFLQDSGYLARAAFLLDRFLHRLGLHGRVFFVLLSGYGCNVPGVMAARILDNPDDRRAAILLEPLVPCAARLGVMTFLVGAFFRGWQATAILGSLLVMDVGLVALAGLGLRRYVLRGQMTPFLLELPDYHWPSLRTLVIAAWQEVRQFVQKAATVILVATALFWLASHLPWGVPGDRTIAGWIGHFFALGLGWIGIDWRLGTALVAGALAKETTLSTLAILLGTGSAAGGAPAGGSWTAVLQATYHPAQLVAFLTVFMLYFPCLATFRVMQTELPGVDRRWLWVGVTTSLGLAIGAGAVAYGIGRWIW